MTPLHRLVDGLQTVALLICTVALAAGPLGCPPGTTTTVSGGVSIKLDPTCTEDRTSPAAIALSPDLALVGCPSVSGTGTVTVTLPRKSWLAMKDLVTDAGPGK